MTYPAKVTPQEVLYDGVKVVSLLWINGCHSTGTTRCPGRSESWPPKSRSWTRRTRTGWRRVPGWWRRCRIHLGLLSLPLFCMCHLHVSYSYMYHTQFVSSGVTDFLHIITFDSNTSTTGSNLHVILVSLSFSHLSTPELENSLLSCFFLSFLSF